MGSTEAPISITAKTLKGSLVTIRGETLNDVTSLLAEGFAALAEVAHELEGAVSSPSHLAPKQATQQEAVQNVGSILGGQVTQVQTEQPVQAGIGGGRACVHGKMTAIQGTGRDGKPYKGYFCSQPKGAFDKCKNQYVFSGSPEWNTFIPEKLT